MKRQSSGLSALEEKRGYLGAGVAYIYINKLSVLWIPCGRMCIANIGSLRNLKVPSWENMGRFIPSTGTKHKTCSEQMDSKIRWLCPACDKPRRKNAWASATDANTHVHLKKKTKHKKKTWKISLKLCGALSCQTGARFMLWNGGETLQVPTPFPQSNQSILLDAQVKLCFVWKRVFLPCKEYTDCHSSANACRKLVCAVAHVCSNRGKKTVALAMSLSATGVVLC